MSAAEVVLRWLVLLYYAESTSSGAGVDYFFTLEKSTRPGEFVIVKNQRTANRTAGGELTIHQLRDKAAAAEPTLSRTAPPR